MKTLEPNRVRQQPAADVSNAINNSESVIESNAPDRNFSLLSISAVGIVTGNSWAAIGGSISVAL